MVREPIAWTGKIWFPSELQAANERLGVLNSEHFGTSKSLKGTGKNKVTKGKNDGRNNMGGRASVNKGGDQSQFLETEDASAEQAIRPQIVQRKNSF